MLGGEWEQIPFSFWNDFTISVCQGLEVFNIDRMKADGASASCLEVQGTRCCARGWDTGIPGCPGLEKWKILFPDNVTISFLWPFV